MTSLVRAVRYLAHPLVRGNASGQRFINTTTRRASAADKPDPNKKNWISFGYSDVHPFLDLLSLHVHTFLAVSVTLVGGFFFYAHLPDPGLKEWSQREAFLQLRRREVAGLPPIDVNYFPLESVKLPTDEELGDTEILI